MHRQRGLDNQYKPDIVLLLTSIFANCGSNASVSRMAAKVSWIVVQLLALWINVCFSSCGDHIQGKSGNVRFPIGGGNVGERRECVWTISVPEWFRVKLTFTDFVMRTTCCSCKHDFLEIRDGSLENSTHIGRFCAKTEPKFVFSTGNVIWVKFTSDFRTYRDNRFRLSYEAVCGRHYAASSGSFSSPRYPLPYEDNKECIYSIAVPKGRIKVKFESFNVEGRMPVCLYDFLEVKEIRYVELSSSQALSQRRRYCGNEKPPIIYSTRGSNLWFRFKSDVSGGEAGFSANYRTISAGEGTCGGTLKDRLGLIYSQNYPYHFPAGQECVWKIQVSPEMHVHLYFDTLNFGLTTGDCENAHLEIYDGPDTSSHQVGRYCGDLIPSKIISRTNELVIKAVSKCEKPGWFSLRYESSTGGACGLQKFTCINRQCIESYHKCDGEKECDDGSDEHGCPDEEGSNFFSWYRFWPVSVIGGMLIVGVWLWRAWKRIMSARSELDDRHTATLSPNQIEMFPSAATIPPSYHEAVAQDDRPPPSYEEALREQINHQEEESDPAQGSHTPGHRDDSNADISTVASLPENTSPASSMVVYQMSTSPCSNHGLPYDSHRTRGNNQSHPQRV